MQQPSSPRRRIAIVSAILHPSYGGPAQVVRNLAEGLRHFHDVDVIGTALPGQLEETRRFLPDAEVFEVKWPRSWFRSPAFTAHFRRVVQSYDLVHLHMVWDHPVWVAARAAAAAGKPYVITPHGTFMEHWRYRSAKKRAYRALLLRDVLPGAAAMHVLSEREQQACRDAGITCPLAVIPNGLAEGAFATARGMQRSRWCGDPGRKYLVYLGRLWHEKGLDLLVEAWAGARRGGQLADWDLVVAGADFRGYRAELERRIGELQVASSVRLVGEVHGEDKAALLRFADAFVQPSRSEALSMSLLEAMAAGLPCVYTTGCNLPSLAECGGGIETAVSAADLQQGLLRVAGLAGEERAAMGQRGRRLALQHYSEQAVMQQLERLYADILEWAAPAAAGPPLLRGELAG